MIKQYVGTRLPTGCKVLVVDESGKGRDLPRQLHLRDHSEFYGWGGLPGTASAQLALAICADALSDAGRALDVYQSFKYLIVAKLPADRWSMTLDDVLRAIEGIELAIAERNARPAGVLPF